MHSCICFHNLRCLLVPSHWSYFLCVFSPTIYIQYIRQQFGCFGLTIIWPRNLSTSTLFVIYDNFRFTSYYENEYMVYVILKVYCTNYCWGWIACMPVPNHFTGVLRDQCDKIVTYTWSVCLSVCLFCLFFVTMFVWITYLRRTGPTPTISFMYILVAICSWVTYSSPDKKNGSNIKFSITWAIINRQG